MLEQPPTASPTDQTYQTNRSLAVQRQPWSPAQLVALVFGVVFAVIGGIALARTGVHLNDLSTPHVSVAGAGQTQLMAYIELAFAALLLAVGAVASAGRGGMITLGILALIFGIVVRAQPSSFYNRLGIGSGYAVFLIVVGAVLLVTAIVAPVYWRTMRRDDSVRQQDRMYGR